jgi:hypothetical protein
MEVRNGFLSPVNDRMRRINVPCGVVNGFLPATNDLAGRLRRSQFSRRASGNVIFQPQMKRGFSMLKNQGDKFFKTG